MSGKERKRKATIKSVERVVALGEASESTFQVLYEINASPPRIITPIGTCYFSATDELGAYVKAQAYLQRQGYEV